MTGGDCCPVMENKDVPVIDKDVKGSESPSRRKNKSKKRGQKSSAANQDAYRERVGAQVMVERKARIFQSTFGDAGKGSCGALVPWNLHLPLRS